MQVGDLALKLHDVDYFSGLKYSSESTYAIVQFSGSTFQYIAVFEVLVKLPTWITRQTLMTPVVRNRICRFIRARA